MAEKKRDYKRERQKEVKSLSTIGIRIPHTLSDDFEAKIETENKTKSQKIRELIEKYTYGSTDQ